MLPLLLLAVLISPAVSSGDHWDYHSTSTWPGTCADGQNQSPIDITGYEASTEEEFRFTNYDVTPTNMKIKNNGHTIQLEADFPGDLPELSGGGLVGSYKFAQLHFHWGNHSSSGSEHTLNGRKFPMEVHWVHFNAKYGALGEAVKHPDGLAVIGVFFTISGVSNTNMDPIVNTLNKVVNVRQGNEPMKEMAKVFQLDKLLPKDRRGFYRYDGSLTTPGCMQVVTWTVLHETLFISEPQLMKFRKVHDTAGYGLGNNFRPVQPANGRKIKSVHTTSTCASSADYSVGSAAVMVVLQLVHMIHLALRN